MSSAGMCWTEIPWFKTGFCSSLLLFGESSDDCEKESLSITVMRRVGASFVLMCSRSRTKNGVLLAVAASDAADVNPTHVREESDWLVAQSWILLSSNYRKRET